MNARVMRNVVPPEVRGRRECRMQVAPAASCARVESTRVSHHRYAEHSGIPCTMVLRLIRDLPGVPGFLATVASRIDPQSFTPASGGQDHTTSPSAGMLSS